MIKKQAVKDTDNPPGQIVNPIPDPITEKNIEQWRAWEKSRNTIDPRFPAAHYEHDLFPPKD